MEKVKGLTLFKKMLLFIVALFVAIAIITSVFFSHSLYTNLRQEFISKATAIAQGLADSSLDTFVYGDAASIQSQIDKFTSISGIGYVFVVDNDKQIISHTFIGVLPVEIVKLVKRERNEALNDELSDEILQKDLSIPGMGRFIDISAPILLGKMGFLHVGMDESVIQRTIVRAIVIQNLIIVAIFGVSILLAYFVMRKISNPLVALTDYSNALSKHDFRTKLIGNFGIDSMLKNSTNEIRFLASSFSRLEEIIMDYIDNLEKSTAEKERIKSELEVARTIQAGLLPRIFPPFPDRKEFGIYASINMAKEVGGDFYDFFLVDDKHLCLVIGDVSGKGVPAALFMAVTKSIIRSVATQGISPAEILMKTNAILYPENDANMFVTLLCGILDIKTGEFVIASGGHNQPLLTDNENLFQYVDVPPGILIGALDEVAIENTFLKLKPGDMFLMYTDGVNECVNMENEFFGDDKLHSSSNSLYSSDVKQFVDNIKHELEIFSNGAPQADDITIVVLRFEGIPDVAGQ
jgi:serine phosphatase RsbU (regulator of sigma subunit)